MCDLIFPVYKIDREQSEENVSKERLKIPKRYSEVVVFENFLKDWIFLWQRSMVLCTSYQSVVKLSRVRIRFFFSEITGPRWLELPIARTHFDSPFEFEPAKFYCRILNVILLRQQKKKEFNIFTWLGIVSKGLTVTPCID